MELDFPDTEVAKAWADAWVGKHYPPRVETELASFEQLHGAEFLDNYGRAVRQFYVQYDALVALIDHVNFATRPSWPAHRTIQYVLLAKNLTAFHSAMDRLSKGFSQDAMGLTRSVYDTFLRVVHVSLFSDAPSGALVDKPPQSVVRFNATSLVQDQLRLSWLGNYALMSIYPHANTLEVIQALERIGRREGTPERFGLWFEDDIRLVETILPFLSFVLLMYLRFVLERLLDSADAPDEPLLSTAHEAVALLTYTLKSSEKEYWRSTATDLDYLFELLKVADAGGDWRAIRNRRPVVKRRRTKPK